MKSFGLWIYEAYQYIFDSKKNPLRHIPDPTSRMYIMTILALMWEWYLRRLSRQHLLLWLKSGRSHYICLLYTSPSPRDRTRSRMPSSA